MKAAADATAYDHVATEVSSLCVVEPRKMEDTEGKPTRKKAKAKKNQGAERIQTDGFNRNIPYQIADDKRKMPPRTYACHGDCQF